MVKKKQKKVSKKKVSKNSKSKILKKSENKVLKKSASRTLNLKSDHEVATDFAVKAYEKFKKLVKSIILFGSVEKEKTVSGSDIDIIIIVDDVSLNWDQELIAWYREELDKILKENPYSVKLHINTIKLSTWWDDLMKGDPVVLNIIRSGFPIIDHAGFIEPLKFLMLKGKIKGTPEAIYQCLQRAPMHIARSKAAELTAIDGLYWSMVDSAHGALIAAGYFPPSPEHVMVDLKEAFTDKGFLKMKYVEWYKDIYYLHKKIDHREILDLKGIEIDMWQNRAEEFMKEMISLVEKIVKSKK
ncbi:MAG: nucleotidyltransferase domain-containing protein [Nanoarchaeota archaeon]|nr:nucleotidyltransferase domain-containing protein [Nanoarchaeota archaeon]